MENWQVAVLILVAVLVGALLPVLLELRATLRAARGAIENTLPQMESGLEDITKLVQDVSQVVGGMQSTTRLIGAVGAALGPAIVAGLSSYRAARAQEADEEKSDEQPAHEPG